MMERITARKNPLLQQVRKLLSSRKEREITGLFVADGTKLLAEAVKWWPGLETVILSDGVEADVPDHVRVISVPKDVMESISPMQTPQGALFLCRLPKKVAFTPKPGMLCWTVSRILGIWGRFFELPTHWKSLWRCWKAAPTLTAIRSCGPPWVRYSVHPSYRPPGLRHKQPAERPVSLLR